MRIPRLTYNSQGRPSFPPQGRSVRCRAPAVESYGGSWPGLQPPGHPGDAIKGPKLGAHGGVKRRGSFLGSCHQAVSTKSMLPPCDLHSPTPTQSTVLSGSHPYPVKENLESMTEHGVTSTCSQEFDGGKSKLIPCSRPVLSPTNFGLPCVSCFRYAADRPPGRNGTTKSQPHFNSKP
jgi:hypothetical protein